MIMLSGPATAAAFRATSEFEKTSKALAKALKESAFGKPRLIGGQYHYWENGKRITKTLHG